MNRELLIELLAPLLEVAPDTLTPETPLSRFDTWDSLSKISVLAAVHERHGISLEGDDLDRIGTVGELTDLLRKASPASAT
jgi:acyl carrier protein